MCGIAGIVTRSGRDSDSFQNKVRRMTCELVHRGPDDSGVWHEGPAYLGHRRLSIIDLSSAGHQPMEDRAHGLVIVYNGEIYNYRELRTELEGLGHQFRTNTDTEVLRR